MHTQPTYTIYKIYIVREEVPRLEEVLNTFDNINSRILGNSKGKYYNRVLVELSEEELLMVKLSIKNNESLIVTLDNPKQNTRLLDDHIETYRE